MRYFWFRSLLIFGAFFAGRPGLAQQVQVPSIAPHTLEEQLTSPPVALPPLLPVRAPVEKPTLLCLLNTAVIVDISTLTISKKDFKTVRVYTEQKGPRQWRGLAANGIADFIVKASLAASVKSKTLAEIGQELMLTGPVTYTINGMPTTETALRIAANAIGEVKVTSASPTLPRTLVEIQIAHRTPEAAAPSKPRIMIRGTASR